ncbi:hypothetical protein [Sutcliffiella rhizosphaerae]|uniref:hypothetical protein n=1 Tax=Sutcliffiella rhizosphaerae TaxID=2880967 RepID=UPI001E5D6B84|nr:hypothetical protein [Sutcliffiella rhizosphaerae]
MGKLEWVGFHHSMWFFDKLFVRIASLPKISWITQLKMVAEIVTNLSYHFLLAKL